MERSRYVRFFDEIGIADVPLVGSKNASLGEIYRKLPRQGVRVPNGFAITAEGYRLMLEEAGAWGPLHCVLDELRPNDVADLARRAGKAREIVYGAGLPEHLASEIRAAYGKLRTEYGEDVSLAVQTSPTAEALPAAGFAGRQETFLNVKGEESLLEACRCCFASLFTVGAIRYRTDRGFDHFTVALSIGVMKMVRSDLASSGVMFTVDTESEFRDAVFIAGPYGLRENVRQGEVPVSTDDRVRFCLPDEDAVELTRCAQAIDAHFGCPMEVEWAKDGVDGKLYVVQARPETRSVPEVEGRLGRPPWSTAQPCADGRLRQ